MRIVLATIGTLGDLHPFLALALALQRGGADVVLASAEEYRDKVQAAGIDFAPLSPSFAAIESESGLSRAEITRRMISSTAFMFRGVVNPHLRAGYEDMVPLMVRADLLLTGSLAFGARLAAEKSGVPWIGIVLQPLMFLSAHDAPVAPGPAWATSWLRRLRPALRRRALAALKLLMLPLVRPVRRLRAQIGLPAAHAHPLFEGQFSTAGAIALYSAVIGPLRPDHPPSTLLAGFAWYDSEDGRVPRLPPDIEQFLQSGSEPLVFTLGSVVVYSPGDFYRHSADAAAALGRRALLLVGDAQYEACRPLACKSVFVARYAPHSLVFARAAALIHHGGIGTLAQALRAGKPQLIVPHFADQFDNAERARLHCGARVLRPSHYRADPAAGLLLEMLGDPALRDVARLLGERVAAEDGAARAAQAILGR